MFPMILAAGMLGQIPVQPPLPDKNPPPIITSPPPTQLPAPDKRQPRATPQATPQGTPYQSQSRQFVPAQQYEAQQYAYQYPAPQAAQFEADIPLRIRLRVIPEVDTYAPAPRAYAAPPAVTYGGGGCYGGSYSAGSYGYSGGFAAQAYAAPAAAVICPSGVCYGGGLSAGGFGLASRPYGRKIKIKEGPGIGLGPRGLRELLGR
jgi:hypothetical protein